MGETESRIVGVHTVSVPVRDQGKALDFYVGTLGLEKRLDVPFGDGDRWIEVAPHGSATTIALPPAHGSARSGIDTGIRLATSDVDADHTRLRELGVDTDPEVLRMGGGVPPMFTFRDQDGNNLFLVQRS